MSRRLTMRPAGPVCDGDQIHAEHVRSDFGGFVGRMRELHAARFAAAAGVNLRFHDDDVGLEPLRAFARFFLGEGDFAARSGDAVAREDSFGLVLVNLHQ